MSLPHKIGDLQLLRGVAIALVVATHLPLTHALAARLPAGVWHPGWLGVDLFFVVSGYVITRSLVRDRFEPLAFVVRRLFRLTPPLAVLVGLTVGLSLTAERWAGPGLPAAGWVPPREEVGWRAAAAVGGVYTLAKPATGGSLLGVVWSLAVEDQFYAAVAVACVVGALAGGPAVDGLPPLPAPPPATRAELLAAVAGGSADVRLTAPKAAPRSTGPVELLPLGDDTFFNKVLLSTRGGAVQQVILTRFDEANRLGREIKRDDGTFQPLRLVPGVLRKRDKTTLTAEAPFPDLVPGRVPDDVPLSEPSYVLHHYLATDDPLRQAKTDADYPSPELAERTWTVVEQTRTPELQRVVFETALDAPYFLTLRKTFTLAPADYHLGFKLEVVPRPGRQKGKGEFRYQLVAGRGLPIEGEWYAQAFRNAMAGWRTPAGGVRRSIEDAAAVHHTAGGTVVPKGENTFAYAAVGTQYFATAICVDDTVTGNASSPWEYVRPTREPHPWDDPAQLVYGDITVRAVARPLDPGPTDTVTHSYLLYNGPLKVRLLNHLKDDGPDRAVDKELVDRYLDRLALNTLTDYHSPNVFGRFANAIYWSDAIIASTNVMHGILRRLHRLVPVWGVDIILLTVLVRLSLFYFSRKQQAMGIRQQALMARLKPDLDKLAEKHKDDPKALQQAKTRLMMQNGMNPLAMSGGCFLLLLQMPIFMGLYFCLQESVFFRNQPFLWFPNLAAPDMLLWWTEKIPWLSAPDSLNGMIYLGPYLNLLPIVGVVLIFLQQHLTMPPALSEEQAQQQKVMKYMVVLMGVFFYRVPSGLSLYFICSTGWALLERQLIPKPKVGPMPPPETATPGKAGTPPDATGGSGGGWWGRMKSEAEARMKDTMAKADQQSSRQIRNDDRPPPNRGPRDKKKRRK